MCIIRLAEVYIPYVVFTKQYNGNSSNSVPLYITLHIYISLLDPLIAIMNCATHQQAHRHDILPVAPGS